MRSQLLSGALWLALLGAPAVADTLPPRDTTDQAPKFARFKQELMEAVQNRDARFFRQRAHNLSVDLDDRFDISDPSSSFWTSMDRLLELGGVWQPEGEMVVYPYVYADFPKSVSALDHDVLTAADVPVYQFSDGIHQQDELSYEIVWVLERGADMSRVRAESGITGYVENKYLYSPGSFRMGLALVDGRWAIVFLVARN